MIQTCKCGKEFLTEADPYVIIPTPQEYVTNCGCYFLRDLEWAIRRIIFINQTTDDVVDPIIMKKIERLKIIYNLQVVT